MLVSSIFSFTNTVSTRLGGGGGCDHVIELGNSGFVVRS